MHIFAKQCELQSVWQAERKIRHYYELPVTGSSQLDGDTLS